MDKARKMSKQTRLKFNTIKKRSVRGLAAQMEDERRKHARFKPSELTFVALRPDFTRLGKIVDISRGGICFQYMVPEDQQSLAAALWVDVFQSASSYYVPSVPCKVVYERRQQSTAFPIGIEYRQCGLEFADLTPEQGALLDLYLANHTAGRV